MDRIPKNMCGYSSYICRGIPSLMSDGMYKDLPEKHAQLGSYLYNCSTYTEGSDSYIWHNFGTIPTTIAIYDNTAQVTELQPAFAGLQLATCDWGYDRYSATYFSVADPIGAVVPSVSLYACYVSDSGRIQHKPGMLDPAHTLAYIEIPQLQVTTRNPKVSAQVQADVDLTAVSMGLRGSGLSIAALGKAMRQQCTGLQVSAQLIGQSDAYVGCFQYKISMTSGYVVGLLEASGSSLGNLYIPRTTWEADSAGTMILGVPGQTRSYYVYIHLEYTINTDGTSYFSMINAGVDQGGIPEYLKTPGVGQYCLHVATVTIGCAEPGDQDNNGDQKGLLLSIDTLGVDTKLSDYFTNPAWATQALAEWRRVAADQLSSPVGKCAASVQQLVCSPAVVRDTQFGAPDLTHTPAQLYIPVTTQVGGQRMLCATPSPDNGAGLLYMTTKDSGYPELKLSQSPAQGSALVYFSAGVPNIVSVDTSASSVLCMQDGALSSILPPDTTGDYVLTSLAGTLTWVRLAAGNAPTFPY